MTNKTEKPEKQRLTLWLDERVKSELKRQAQERGVSVSAYISMIVTGK